MPPDRSKRKRSAVPKFSSFRPASGTHQDQVEKRDESVSAKPILLPQHARSAGNTHPPSPTTRDRGDAVFLVDKQGDPLIRRYGTNDRRAVPSYRRFGSGRVLGSDRFMRLERTGNHEQFFFHSHHDSGSLLGSHGNAILARTARRHAQVLRVRRETCTAVTGNEDYLPLGPSEGLEHDSHLSDSSEADEPPYGSIRDKTKSRHCSDSPGEYDGTSSTNPPTTGADDQVSQESVKLFTQVRHQPEDTQAWLDLVRHQDVLLQLNVGHGHQPTMAEIKSYADIKLHMLQQAFVHAPDHIQRESLQLHIMREGSKVWDQRTLAKRWEDTRLGFPRSFELWKAYMNYRQTSLRTLQYSETKQLYVEQLRLLNASVAELEPDPDRHDHGLYEKIVYVFSRLTRFVSEAGFPEIAFATWQATLELTFARPRALTKSSKDETLSNFRDFWESEVPRLGEDSAQGWAAFHGDGGKGQGPSQPKNFDINPHLHTRDAYKAWSTVEQHHMRSSTLPARTWIDTETEDPFRVVMFEDIEDLLPCISLDVQPIQQYLLDAYLIFCSLPPAFGVGRLANEMIQDEFIVRKPILMPHCTAEPGESSNGPDRDPPVTRHGFQHLQNSNEVLFPLEGWFPYMAHVYPHMSPDMFRYVATTLSQLIRTCGIKGLGPYYLAFESINEPGNEKQVAKALLKHDTGNIDLYLGYSTLEWNKGKKASSHNVLSAALSLPGISAYDRLRLVVADAWLYLYDGLSECALQICTFVEANPTTNSDSESAVLAPTLLLKARQYLSSTRDYLVSSAEIDMAVTYAKALALLEYATQQSNREPSNESQGDIWSALSSIRNCSEDDIQIFQIVSRGQRSNRAHEDLLQFASRMLAFHATRGPFRQGYLREQLAAYIELFPRNTMFLSLFAWREPRLGVDDRVRRLLSGLVLAEPHDCLSSRFFAIGHEWLKGNLHSTQAAFEHAVSSEKCRHHPGFWMSYIRFCQGTKTLRPKAKDVFYRAMQACPWSKEVFMEAFVTLGREMDTSDLRSVYDTLCEKGLRVHVEMDGFVEEWRKGQTEGSRG
ncbi:DUF1740-domain-containing protein [Xylariomycetidae sp. FL2044]|nr:DUF1740-domain-containing protein [Xylariomycetidae sp. FL2044]